ncbi:unnamed protein product [Bursaphelenchus xylophilus]|uniref:(pine wood nematode) hypothetical protein n=1 Tax=Bursaphelenchus xylophilus TaxID=6326 RepID=A0A1I7SQZ5_BURXY|nr:unnamed protein product [Bursaphelenchus xylophilus]CAG9110613.1 unnamed protein product [Bursaphelenchus xylophilus]
MHLFEPRIVANFGQKSTDDPVISFTGTKDKVIFGTHKGKLIRCRMEADQLVYDKSVMLSSQNAIQQLSYVPHNDLLMAVVADGIVHITESTLTLLATTGAGSVLSMAVNADSIGQTAAEGVLFAVATNKKSILICKRTQEDKEVTVDVLEKINVSGEVSLLSFSANSICYVMDSRYFVVSLRGGAREHHELIATEDKAIIEAIRRDEYCISADDGLLVFVDSKGVSNRPPISTNINVLQVCFIDPLLYVVGHNHLLIYNLNDETFKVSISIPNLSHVTSTEHGVYLLTDEKVVMKLDLADYEGYIQKLYEEDPKKGLEALEKLKSALCHNSKVQNFIQTFLEKMAVKYIEEGDQDEGLRLFIESDADPIVILSRIRKLNTQAAQEMIFKEIELADDKIMEFLEASLLKSEENETKNEIMSYLIRLELLMDKINLDHLNESLLFDDELREWILENGYHSLAAEICFENGLKHEGLEIWKEFAEKNDGKKVDFDGLMFRLGTMLDEPCLIQKTLQWLAPKSPENAMEIINQLPNLDFEWILSNFNTHSKRFVIDYFSRNLLGKDVSHDVLIEVIRIYSKLIEEDLLDQNLRRDFRNLIFNINYSEEIAEILKKNECLKFENAVFSSKLENVVERLSSLLEEDLDLAEALFLRFCDQKPEIVYIIAPFYLKEEKDPTFQNRFLHLLSQTRPFRGVEKLFPKLSSASPAELLTVIHNSIERVESDLQTLKIREALNECVISTTAHTKKEKKGFWTKEGDRCDICRESLDQENISFLRDVAVHTKCVRRV